MMMVVVMMMMMMMMMMMVVMINVTLQRVRNFQCLCAAIHIHC